ncbi:hypothetical protein ACLB2K_006841 [Fragaria x ananassa]
MRLADSGICVGDGDPVELLSTGGGCTIKGGAPGITVPAGMGVGWLLLPVELTLCHIESIKALALVDRELQLCMSTRNNPKGELVPLNTEIEKLLRENRRLARGEAEAAQEEAEPISPTLIFQMGDVQKEQRQPPPPQQQVDKLIFPADFYVLEMEDSPMNSASLLLGRPFMRMARTKIDVYASSLTMEFDGEVIGFNIFEAMRYPLHEINSCFSVDIIDTLVQEFLKALKEDVLETTIEQGIGFTSNGIPISPKELKETFGDAIIETVAYLEALPHSERHHHLNLSCYRIT